MICMAQSWLQMKVTIERRWNPGPSKTQPTCIHGHDLWFRDVRRCFEYACFCVFVFIYVFYFYFLFLWKLNQTIECICILTIMLLHCCIDQEGPAQSPHVSMIASRTQLQWYYSMQFFISFFANGSGILRTCIALWNSGCYGDHV